MYTPDQPLNNPEWELDEAYREAWLEAREGDSLYDNGLWLKVDRMIWSTTWDHDTKNEFLDSLPEDMSNGEREEVLDYLRQYQPRVPFTEVKNPSQKQINAFIRKVCNL